MQLVTQNNFSLLAPQQIEGHILHTLGIKTSVRKEDGKVLILCQHYNSCFEIMRKLRLEFDYSVHKRGKLYLLEI